MKGRNSFREEKNPIFVRPLILVLCCSHLKDGCHFVGDVSLLCTVPPSYSNGPPSRLTKIPKTIVTRSPMLDLNRLLRWCPKERGQKPCRYFKRGLRSGTFRGCNLNNETARRDSRRSAGLWNEAKTMRVFQRAIAVRQVVSSRNLYHNSHIRIERNLASKGGIYGAYNFMSEIDSCRLATFSFTH